MYSKPEGYSKSSPTSAKNSLIIITRLLPIIYENFDENFIETLFFNNTIPTKKDENTINEKETKKNEEVIKKEGENKEIDNKEIDKEEENKEGENKEEESKKEKKEEEEIIIEDNKKIDKEDKKIEDNKIKIEDKFEDVDIDQNKFNYKIDRIGNSDLKTSLADVFINSLMNLLFIPGFTIPEAQLVGQQKDKNDSLEQPIIWDGGIIVSKENRKPTTEIIQNRIEVIRCFLVLFSQYLYIQRKI
jgi:hypothetical protein